MTADPPADRRDECRPLDPDLVQLLHDADLDDLTHRLLAYAQALIRQRIWRGLGWSPPGGLLARDLVQEAFAKVLGGERRRHQPISLYQLLAGIIRSDVSHLGDRIENAIPHEPLESADAIDGRSDTESRFLAAELVARMLELFRDDATMRRYLALLTQEVCDDAASYAIELGVTRGEVYNMNRRLARWLRREKREE